MFKKIKKAYKIYSMVFFVGVIALFLVWLVVNIVNKNLYACPEGQVSIGNGECRGTGLGVPFDK